jgi:hypothetical protein
MDSTPRLRVVEPATVIEPPVVEPLESAPSLAREDYWARVQQLRTDLARLRPAN